MTPEQEITWEKFQYAIGVLATSPKSAMGRLPDVYKVLTDKVEGIDPEDMPLSIRDRYKDWLATFESGVPWTSVVAMGMCHILWSLYQVFREQIETGTVASSSIPSPRILEVQPPRFSKEMALSRLNLVLMTVDELPLFDWQEEEVKKCSDILGVRMPNEEESFLGYVRHVLETVGDV